MGQGQFDVALGEFQAAQALEPEPSNLQRIAECHEALGHLREAMEAYEQYLQQAPESADQALIAQHMIDLQANIHIENGRKYVEEKKYVEAEKEFEAAQKVKADPKLWYDLANAQELAGDDLKAIESYRKYLQAVPEAPDAGEIQGRINILSGKHMAPPPAAPPPPKPLTHKPAYTSKAGMATLFLGLAFLAGGATSVGLSTMYASNADSARREADFYDNVERGKITQYVGITGLGVGAALLVASIAILYVHTRPFAEAAPPPAPVKEFVPTSWLLPMPAAMASGGMP